MLKGKDPTGVIPKVGSVGLILGVVCTSCYRNWLQFIQRRNRARQTASNMISDSHTVDFLAHGSLPSQSRMNDWGSVETQDRNPNTTFTSVSETVKKFTDLN